MAVLSTATASGRIFYCNSLSATNATLYTAPALSPNVTATVAGTSTNIGSGTAGSSTSYIKEITLCNTSGNAVTVTIFVNGVAIIQSLSINAYDTKVLGGLNTFLNATAQIQGSASTASVVNCVISGVEIQ